MTFWSAVATSVSWRKLRLRFWLFFVMMWLLNAFERMILPEPVTRNRFAVPR